MASDRFRFPVQTNTSPEHDHSSMAPRNDRLEESADTTMDSAYRAPWWLPGGTPQTIFAYYRKPAARFDYRRERWKTPDGDFIDLDWVDGVNKEAPLLVLFHGLEGCSRSHYALALMSMARQRGWHGVVPNFRGCSGEPNRLARSYHSGDSEEIDWILRRLHERHSRFGIFVVGVSIGGNMLLKWLGEQGGRSSEIVRRAAGVSVPVDLAAAARELDRGIKRLIYTESFLRPLRRKALEKIAAHALPLDIQLVRRASTFQEFDNLYTAPVHGFRDAQDYWTRASSKPWLKGIKVPTLLVHALNDPFLPATALPGPDEVSNAVTLDYPVSGGHVGFVSGKFPGNSNWLSRRVWAFFNGER